MGGKKRTKQPQGKNNCLFNLTEIRLTIQMVIYIKKTTKQKETPKKQTPKKPKQN